jgi:hypothetical protein
MAHLNFKDPGPQVLGYIVGVIYVFEMFLRGDADLEGTAQKLSVPGSRVFHPGVKLLFVEQLGSITAQEPELVEAREFDIVFILRSFQYFPQPMVVPNQIVEEESIALGDRGVAQAFKSEGQLGSGIDGVLGVASLVEEGSVVILTTDGFDDQFDLVGHADGSTEGPRAFQGTGFCV